MSTSNLLGAIEISGDLREHMEMPLEWFAPERANGAIRIIFIRRPAAFDAI
jgi:hypothetical protein